MKTAIIYYSRHHENTKKLLLALLNNLSDITIIDAADPSNRDISLDGYDLIGFASGIYYSKFHKSVLNFANDKLPESKKVFFLCTYGVEKAGYTDAIEKIALKKSAEILGSYGCLGFNTFGPFKLIGGIAKGHPTNTECADAVKFYTEISER